MQGNSCGKFLSSGKILQENIAGNSCGKYLQEKWQKTPMSAIFGTFFAIFRSLIENKTSPNYFFSCRGGSKLQFGGKHICENQVNMLLHE